MKKRKLKKKIKELKKELEMVVHDGKEAFNNQSSRISTLGDKYIKLREDFNRLNQNSNVDGLQFQINDIYEKLKILKLRTETDYTQFKPLVDTSKGPDCNNCRYDGLGMDGPCFGCTETDKKMYEPKETKNGVDVK